MRDDRKKWAPAGQWQDGFSVGRVRVARVMPERQTLISGPDVLRQLGVPLTEWPDVCRADRYALSLRRDRALIVNADAHDEGWDDARSQAASDVSDLYSVFDVYGDDALSVLKRGTELSLMTPSKSVVRRWFGLHVMVYRHSAEDRFRLHVERANEEAFLGYLRSAAQSADAGHMQG